MLDQGYIDSKAYEEAITAPITTRYHGALITVEAPYVAEMVRTAMLERYGDDAYTLGLNVYTTIDSVQAKAANKALRTSLLAYDRRHCPSRPP